MRTLTPRQAEVLAFIQAQLAEKGYPPTTRELAAALGVKSPHGIGQHIDLIVRKGYLRRDPMRSRGLCLTSPTQSPIPTTSSSTVAVPIYRRISPGPSPFQPWDVLETIRLGRESLGEESLFGLRLEGQAISGMGYRPGDNVLFLRRPILANGELACVSFGGGVFVRFVHQAGENLVLMPANPTFETITIPPTMPRAVHGVAVGMWRPLPSSDPSPNVGGRPEAKHVEP